MKAWFPLYPADFLADTTHLSAEEVGIYFRFLCHQWQHGSLPSNSQQLARISGEKESGFKSVLDEFFAEKRGKLVNSRMDRERKKAKEISDKRKELGRKGGLAKASHLLQQSGKQKPTQPQPQKDNTNTGLTPPGGVDLKRQYWDRCKPALLAAKVPAKQVGSLLGALLKRHGDAAHCEQLVLRAVTKAEPATWLWASCKPEPRTPDDCERWAQANGAEPAKPGEDNDTFIARIKGEYRRRSA